MTLPIYQNARKRWFAVASNAIGVTTCDGEDDEKKCTRQQRKKIRPKQTQKKK